MISVSSATRIKQKTLNKFYIFDFYFSESVIPMIPVIRGTNLQISYFVEFCFNPINDNCQCPLPFWCKEPRSPDNVCARVT